MIRVVFGVVISVLFACPGEGAAEGFDVVVYGGTPSGVAAAVAAAREGGSVLLLEQKRHVGGLNTSGLVNSEGNHMTGRTFGGISLEFYKRLGRAYGSNVDLIQGVEAKAVHRWESHKAEEVFNEMLKEAKVPVRFDRRVQLVEKQGAHIRRIVMVDGSAITGKVFIDATYEGDLMARAGVSYTFGREGIEKYGEPLAGIRLAGKPITGSPYDEDGKLLPGVSTTIDQLKPGAGDDKVMTYNFRLCFTKRKDNMVAITRPESYNPKRYLLLANYLAAHPKTRLRNLLEIHIPINGKYEINNQHDATISIGHFGGQFDYPDADYAGQDQIWQDHKDYTQGLLYFLGHDPSVPEALRKEMLQWGLAKDEFADNDHWPYYLYVREARRMIGRYVMIQKDVQDNRSKPDTIGLGSHAIDSHHVQRVALSETEFTNEGRLWIPGKVYEIPYRCLTPKAEQCDNLLVPVCASFSHVAFCTLRVEPTWMTTGQSAGTAAALAAQTGKAVQDVNVKELQGCLRAAGQILDCQ